MVGILSRTHIPHRPWSLHCEIGEGMPKALGYGAANLAPAKVGGLDRPPPPPGNTMTQKIGHCQSHLYSPEQALFRGGPAVWGHGGHIKGQARGREVGSLKK